MLINLCRYGVKPQKGGTTSDIISHLKKTQLTLCRYILKLKFKNIVYTRINNIKLQ